MVRIGLNVSVIVLAASAAHAVPIAPIGTEGFRVFASGGDVIAKFEGSTAAYTNLLYLDDGDADFTNDLFIFNNQVSIVGSTVSLGTFSAGTELLFRIDVTNLDERFFSGPGTRNVDGQPHARVQSDYAPGTTLVSFEDLLDGPFDYNDLSFTFSNTVGSVTPPDAVVPLPAGIGLLATALGMLALRRAR